MHRIEVNPKLSRLHETESDKLRLAKVVGDE
jgi:hypothetical protein